MRKDFVKMPQNKQPRKTTIRARLMRLGVINIIVAASVMIFTSTLLQYIGMDESFQSEGESLASAYGSMINNNIDTMLQDITQFANDPKMVDESIPLDERKAYLAELASHTVYKDMSIAYSDGKTYNDTDLSQRKYWQEAMKGNTYISSPVSRLTDNSTVIMVGTPLHIEGFSGVLYGAIDATTLSSGFNELSYGYGADLLVIDPAGQIVASTDSSQILNLESDTELLSLIPADKDYGNIESNGSLISFYRITDSDGWTLVVRSPRAYVIHKVLNTSIITVICGLILLVIDVIICRSIAEKISTPIKQITTRMKSLSDGDIYSPCEITYRADETGELATCTTETISHLQTYIGDIDARLQKLAEGDLTANSTINYIGDFIKLKESLNQFQKALHKSMDDINTSVENLHNGASQISESSQHLSENAITQAEAAEQIQSVIKEISAKATATAESASTSAELANTVKNDTDTGKAVLADLIAAIQNIQEKSNAISDIVKTISDISFQTNILALNASIEAARAGEAGKGFSVVASEVGNLANKSAEATKRTTDLINETRLAVETGTSLADNASEQMQKIVTGINTVSEHMANIATAASAQQTAVEQATAGIEQINNGLQTATAAAEESAASSEELYGLADMLNQTLNTYKL